MAELSQTDLEAIAKYPLDDSLDHLRDILRKADESVAASALDDGTGFKLPGKPRLLAAASEQLLAVLRNHEVASEIRSKTRNLDLYSELQKIMTRIAREFNYQYFRPLAQLVINKASDTEVWAAVLNLVTNFSRTTPPPSASTSFDGTPIIRSSSSFQGNEQTKRHLDVALQYELRGRIFRDVQGFFEKYFEQRSWSQRCTEIYNAMKKRHANGRWLNFPDPPDQVEVWNWLTRLQEDFFSDAPGTYYTTKSTSNMTGGEAPRQLDIFLKSKSVTTLNHDWKDVLVIGEHKQSHHGPKELLLQLTRYMRDVFTSQPTRRFVHGFFMHGSTMELWVFDRSGAYSSGEFDIHEEPEKFIRALVGYAFMSNEELGLDTFIVRKGNKHTIIFENDVRGKERKLELDQEPFVKQRAVVCRGTTCFRTADHSNVVKFSWTSDKRPPESDHLRLARQKGLKGIANFIGYQSITSIDELRSGLVFGRPWIIRGDTTLEFTPTQSHVSHSLKLLQVSRGRSDQKRRLSTSAASSQISKSDSHRNVVDRGYEMNPPVSDNGAKKRRSFSEDATIRKRSKLSSHGSRLQEEPNMDSSSLYELSNDKYDNRIFGCLAISPAGRALNDFNSIPELLNALRDAIKAHRSLYLVGQILHRDISENNIIITNPEQADGFTGMLIDLDLAKPAGSSKTGARHQTGTVEFMAIQVLRKAVHTYRHDLESFFYVLLWICGRRVWEKGFLCNRNERPREDVFRRWYSGSFEEIARSKQGDMHADGFKQILSRFPPALGCVKPLCTEIRRILFPLTTEGELDIGTPPNPEHLYDRIIEEFEAAVSAVADAGHFVGLL